MAHREIELHPSAMEPPVRVYDTSGPYSDPNATIDLEKGLPRHRTAWIEERGHVVSYDGRDVRPEDNGNVGEKHLARAFPITNRPYKGRWHCPVTQFEFARAGIITKEMIYIAERENLGRKRALDNATHKIAEGESFRRGCTGIHYPRICASAGGGWSGDHSGQHQPHELEAMIIGRNFLVKINANIGNSAVASSVRKKWTRWSGRPAGAPTM